MDPSELAHVAEDEQGLRLRASRVAGLEAEHEPVVRGDGRLGRPLEQHLTGHAQVDRQEEIAAEQEARGTCPAGARRGCGGPARAAVNSVGRDIQQHELVQPVDGTDAAARQGRRQLTADRLDFG